MSSTDAIFSQAEQRGKQIGLSYAGAMPPADAYALQSEAKAVIVDVRTTAELAYVGRVSNALAVEWQSYPTMEVNQRFLEELQAQLPPADSLPVLFLCRSGARSHYAATVAAEAGYRAYNILEGFEGDLNEARQRNTVNGWRARGLPWEQS